MGDDKIQELLLQLVQDMSFVKAKLSSIEEQKLSARIDSLEAQNREHDRTSESSCPYFPVDPGDRSRALHCHASWYCE